MIRPPGCIIMTSLPSWESRIVRIKTCDISYFEQTVTLYQLVQVKRQSTFKGKMI